MVKINNMSEEYNKVKSVVRVVGEINSNSLDRFLDQTDKIVEAYQEFQNGNAVVKNSYTNSFPRITIDISSYGGCTDCLSAYLSQIDSMREIGIHVDTYASFAYSAGLILFAYGERRSASKYSKFLNHQSSTRMQGTIDAVKLDVDFASKCDRQFDDILIDAGMPKERVEMVHKNNANDWFLYDEAIELGLVNYYEGCELERELKREQIENVLDTTVSVFSQMLGLDREEGLETMIEIFTQGSAEAEEKEEVEEKPTTKVEITKENGTTLTMSAKDIQIHKIEDNQEDTPSYNGECFKVHCEECDKAKECLNEILEAVEDCRRTGDCEECGGREDCEDDIIYIDEILRDIEMRKRELEIEPPQEVDTSSCPKVEEEKDFTECFKVKCLECEEGSQCLSDTLNLIKRCGEVNDCDKCVDYDGCLEDITYIYDTLDKLYEKKYHSTNTEEIIEKMEKKNIEEKEKMIELLKEFVDEIRKSEDR